MKNFILALFIGLFSLSLSAQSSDSLMLRKFFDMALSEGKAHEDLRSLCKDIGARLTGSAEAEMAIKWGKQKLEGYGFDKVYLQEIKVPHWERGTTEAGWYTTADGKSHKVKLLALGGSESTNGLMQAEVIEFKSLEALKAADKATVEGKIVFINQAMDAKQISTFNAYGGCWAVRGRGAAESAQLGAKAVIIRSLGLPLDDHPHTGSMAFKEGEKRIPGAAISTQASEALSKAIAKGKVSFALEMDCRAYPDVTSYNVIAEISGSDKAEEIITFGGHLDSWDVGEGAHDDGAGIIHSMEALRILKESGLRPSRTLRVVFFMNEENGNRGGVNYAKIVKEKGERQVAAIESDAGGFSPRGFSLKGSEQQLELLRSFEQLLKPYQLHIFEMGYGGVDINPLKEHYPDIPLFGLRPDSQRYFDFHHSEADVFENVNKRELEMGCGAMASLIYLLDKYLPSAPAN